MAALQSKNFFRFKLLTIHDKSFNIFSCKFRGLVFTDDVFLDLLKSELRSEGC